MCGCRGTYSAPTHESRLSEHASPSAARIAVSAAEHAQSSPQVAPPQTLPVLSPAAAQLQVLSPAAGDNTVLTCGSCAAPAPCGDSGIHRHDLRDGAHAAVRGRRALVASCRCGVVAAGVFEAALAVRGHHPVVSIVNIVCPDQLQVGVVAATRQLGCGTRQCPRESRERSK